MKQQIHVWLPLLAVSALAVNVCQGTTVFYDTFSQTPGTQLLSSTPDVGVGWTGNANVYGGSPVAISAGNSLSTSGDARYVYAAFNSSLGAGQVLTLSYDTLGLTFNSGYAGVSLNVGGLGSDVGGSGTQAVFTGSRWYSTWGIEGAAINGGTGISTGDTTPATHVNFTYAYDSGAWTFTTTAGVNLSGVGTADEALDTLEVHNNNGGDINVDNLLVDISPVPEPTSLALIGLGGLGFAIYRRRH